MATPIEGLRAELKAALDVVLPQIRGLEALVQTPFSEAVLEILREQIDIRQQRVALIAALIAALNGLEKNGYPALPGAVVPKQILDEIVQQIKDMGIAAAIFDAVEMAAVLRIKTGPVVAKL